MLEITQDETVRTEGLGNHGTQFWHMRKISIHYQSEFCCMHLQYRPVPRGGSGGGGAGLSNSPFEILNL